MPLRSYDPIKRKLDLFLGTFALIGSLPLQVLIAVLIRRNLGAPVFFRQIRPGKDAVPFELIKFRTMLELDPDADLVTDEQRLTEFGSFLRSTSLDELPTLINVVRGDMSLVGPRPLLLRYVGRYSPEQSRRHEVRPGITGLAQISGRNAISWDEKLAKDVAYVIERSLLLDFKIMFRTLAKVLSRDGITDTATVTMTEFFGNEGDVPGG